jgi:hypothetical protein
MVKKIKLSCGFTVKIDTDDFNDYRLLKKLAKLKKAPEEEQIELTVEVFNKILGEEQSEALEEYLADDKGRVSIDKLEEAVSEAVEKANNAKNH